MDEQDIAATIQSEEFGRKVFSQLMEIFIAPEVARRQEVGDLEKPLPLRAAEIILFPDGRPPEVRVNSEVKAVIKAKHKPGVTKKAGDPLFEHEIEGFTGVHLSADDDPDCGHILLLRIRDEWSIFFDFRLNQDLAGKHIAIAREFCEAAEFSLTRKNWSAFVDNLFSAAELSAKAELLPVFADLRASRKHSAVHSKYNLFARLGNVEPSHKDALNRLSRLRYPARYLQGEISIPEKEAIELLETVRNMMARH